VTDWTGCNRIPRLFAVVGTQRPCIAPSLRNGELLIAMSLSAVFTVSLYLPLKNLMPRSCTAATRSTCTRDRIAGRLLLGDVRRASIVD